MRFGVIATSFVRTLMPWEAKQGKVDSRGFSARHESMLPPAYTPCHVIGNTAVQACWAYHVCIAHPAICPMCAQKGGKIMAVANPIKISFARILVPTDFSEISDKALDFAKAIGKRDHSEILLAHVFAPVSPITPAEAGWFDEEASLRRLNEELEEKGLTLRAEGLMAHAVSLSGSVQQEILSAAEREHADLIVLGTHQKPLWERLFAGSDAEAVYREARPPVLVIGPLAQPIGMRTWQPKSVTCATDLAPKSADVVAYAYRLAEEYHAQFTVFHLTDPTIDEAGAVRRDFEEIVREKLAGTTLPKDSWRLPLTWSPLEEAIVRHATDVNADLLVMRTPAHTLLKRHFLEGTASRVIHTAPCPVMIVHC